MGTLASYLTQPGGDQRIAVISGPPGMGKSALAIAVAHGVASYFRHGQFYIQLPWSRQSAENVSPGIARVAEAMKIPVDRFTSTAVAKVPNRRKMLVVLDGVDGTFESKAILTPHLRSCALILTSREAVPDAGKHLAVELGRISDDDSSSLLTSLVPHLPIDEDSAFIQRIISEAQGIPYILGLAAAALKLRVGWELNAIESRMDFLPAKPGGRPCAGEYVFDLCFALLTQSQRSALLRLGSLGPGVFTSRQIDVAAGAAADRQSVNVLAAMRLIERVTDEQTGRAAFRMTSLMSDYLASRQPVNQITHPCTRSPSQRITRSAAETRPLPTEDYVRNLYDQGKLENALDAARNAVTLMRESVPGGPEYPGSDLGRATALVAELHTELCLDDAESLAKRAAAALRPEISSVVLRCLATLARRMQDADSARRQLTTARNVAGAWNDQREIVRVLRDLALTEAQDGRPNQALEIVTSARDLCKSLGEGSALFASLLCAYGSVLADKGELAKAEQQLLESARIANESGFRLWIAWADYQRAHTLLRQKRTSHARDLAFRAMDNFTRMRHRYGTARCRFLTGQALREEDLWVEAAIELEDAVAGFRTCNDDWMEAQAKDLLGDVLRRAYPDRKHQANKLKASAADSFRLLASSRRNAAALAQTGVFDGDA